MVPLLLSYPAKGSPSPFSVLVVLSLLFLLLTVPPLFSLLTGVLRRPSNGSTPTLLLLVARFSSSYTGGSISPLPVTDGHSPRPITVVPFTLALWPTSITKYIRHLSY